MDGATWEQGFFDLHRPDAVRILDWGHAAEYIVKAGQAVFGVGTAACSQWLEVQLQELRHGDVGKVLGKLRGLKEGLGGQGDNGVVRETVKAVAGSLEYLEKRKEQIRYAEFEAKGYPIGSGAVESANKLVVEARLKGSGMHWAREHVNPMVALRTVACNDRWEEAWPQMSERLCQQVKERAEQRRAARGVAKALEVPIVQDHQAQATDLSATLTSQEEQAIPPQAGPKPTTGSTTPAANHPWRRIHIGRATWTKPRCTTTAET